LQEFNCVSNQITEIPIEITNCKNIDIFLYSNNPIEYIPPQIQRWLDPIEYIPPQIQRLLNRNKTSQEIYNDLQSVHNHNIRQGITNSINYIMKSMPTLDKESLKLAIINNALLEERTKQLLFDYIEDKSIHSILNITFEELLISVYDFALKHEHKDAIFTVLNTEMKDSLCKFFTGRISRLINTLNGFDEKIIINISDYEQIENICILIKEKLGEKYTEELFKQELKEALQERNYSESAIAEWLDNESV
jgi:hypothetical protein